MCARSTCPLSQASSSIGKFTMISPAKSVLSSMTDDILHDGLNFDLPVWSLGFHKQISKFGTFCEESDFCWLTPFKSSNFVHFELIARGLNFRQ